MAFHLVALREEQFLRQAFGADHAAYAGRVPRFLPNPLLYRDEAEVTFKTDRFGSTLADGLVFLAAIPLVPVLILLPQACCALARLRV